MYISMGKKMGLCFDDDDDDDCDDDDSALYKTCQFTLRKGDTSCKASIPYKGD